MKYIQNIDTIKYDSDFWKYLEYINNTEFSDNMPDNQEEDKYLYLGCQKGAKALKTIEKYIAQAEVMFSYVMHLNGSNKLQWGSPFIPKHHNGRYDNAKSYLHKHDLWTYHGIIMLENQKEIIDFIKPMKNYPSAAHYVNFYLFLCTNIVLEIGHHNEVFFYQKNTL